ncbi:cystathionine beta-lyase [Desulfomarina sp.]
MKDEIIKLPATINPPIYHASTVLFKNYEEMRQAGTGQFDGPTYGTDRMPVQRAFEKALCDLEKGSVTRLFPSGLSAIQNMFWCFAKSGDHILVVDNAYGPGVSFCRKILARFNIETTFIPPSAGKNIVDFIRPETVLILLESPGSNTFEIQDIPAITTIAREKKIITALDNTWATPLYLNPFDLGIDISIQSVTKYISGYSDVLMGALTVTDTHADILENFYSRMEIYAPENDCYMALRGLRSLATRLRQHEQSAIQVAKYLEQHGKIDCLFHPALPSHPEHHLWKRDFSGSSGLFGFTLKQEYNDRELAEFIDSLELFGLGYSWGGFKSLLTAARQRRRMPSRYSGKRIIRLHIGLEPPEDLILDLERGLAKLR